MKLLHTSDWHVGRRLHGVDLSEDHRKFFRFLVDLVRSEKVDAVLVSGDVFDRAVPDVDSISILDDALGKLCALTKVILTPGNHDSAVRLGQNEKFLNDHLVIRTKLEDIGKPVLVSDGQEEVAIYPLPFIRVDEGRRFFASDPTDEETWPKRSHEAVVSQALVKVHQNLQVLRQDNPKLPSIVMAHLFAVGGSGSDSERDLKIGGVDSVPYEVFATLGGADPDQKCPVNYFALGHLHGPQEISGTANTVLRYAGSPLAFSFSEANHKKSVTLLEVNDAKVTQRAIPTPVSRRLVTITDTMEAIEGGKYDQYADYYAAVNVTGDVYPSHMKQRILKVLPHTLTYLFVPNSDPSFSLTAPVVVESSDPVEVCQQFFATAGNTELSENLKRLIQDAVEAVREGAKS